MTKPTTMTCGAVNRAGLPCGRPRGWGTSHPRFGRCKLHGGAAPSAAIGAAREEVKALATAYAREHQPDLDPDSIDAASLILEAAAATRQKRRWLASLIEKVVQAEAEIAEGKTPGEGWRGEVRAVVGDAWGEHGKTGEYLRALVLVEGQERDRMARMGKVLHDAGIAEARLAVDVRVAELLSASVLAGLDAAGITGPARDAALAAAAERLQIEG